MAAPDDEPPPPSLKRAVTPSSSKEGTIPAADVGEGVLRAELRRFGADLRRERSRCRLTQERLAELAELNIRTLQRIEAGEINVLLTTVLRLHRALRCSWERLLPAGEQDAADR